MIYRDAFLKSLNIPFSIKKEIAIAYVRNDDEGVNVAKELLYGLTDRNTSLFLSGGSTPKELYRTLAQEKKLHAGAVGLVDERFGKKLHSDSNEKMIKDSGLLDYFHEKSIPFYPILGPKSLKSEGVKLAHPGGVRQMTPRDLANKYAKVIIELFGAYERKIAILGVGLDGHTAGIPAQRIEMDEDEQNSFVWFYENFPGSQKERISLTFKGLSKINLLIVLVFGEDKKEALLNLFKEGLIEEIPARFLKQVEIVSKTLLITDQQV